MPIKNIIQPLFININDTLRLKKFDEICLASFDWYQDLDTVYLVDGIKIPYDLDKLKRMYNHLNNHGELYYIEILENNVFIPIGDVTFCQYDMPIVIGDKKYRNKGIGKLVLQTLIARAKELKMTKLNVKEIYKFNKQSQKTFESLGFKQVSNTEISYSYSLDLEIN